MLHQTPLYPPPPDPQIIFQGGRSPRPSCESHQSERSSTTDETPRRGLRILLAEDEADFRTLLATALTSRGHRVEEIANGHELASVLQSAISSREPARIDAVVSDICMPGPSGLQFLGALNSSHLNIPVILMTAYGAPKMLRRALAMRAAAVLVKPFQVDDIDKILHGVTR